MTFFSKIKWVLGILVIFVLIVATNLIDRDNFTKVRDSAVSIYEDRLVAKSVLIDLTKYFHQKELAIVSSDANFFETINNDLNENIETLLLQYNDTKLTKAEDKLYGKVVKKFEDIKASENVYVSSNFENDNRLRDEINAMKSKLEQLSEIQLTEGALLVAQSRRALDTVELFTQIEIYLLIFMAIVIQIIIIYTPKSEN